jgi:uncharacterized repeat protein (TIGR01451 family)
MKRQRYMTWFVLFSLVAQLVLQAPVLVQAQPLAPPALGLSDLSIAVSTAAFSVTPLPQRLLVTVNSPIEARSAILQSGTRATTGQAALQRATVLAPNHEPEAYTDQSGWYVFEGLPHGTHKVTIDLSTLPLSLRPPNGEAAPVLWLVPGMQRTAVLLTGVGLSATYHENGDISGRVFVDVDGDGRLSAQDSGLLNVRVIDPMVHQYFVPFNDTDLWTLFDDKDTGLPAGQTCQPFSTPVAGTLESSVFLIASSDGTIFYYDHWEDGYDVDPLSPGSTTEVGILDAGALRLFQNSIDPALVSNPAVFFYDGRDRITVVGAEASVVRLAFPSTPGAVLAAAWETIEVADWGLRFVAALGEDLAFNPTPGVEDHNFAGLEVMAAFPDTEVYYDGAWVATLDVGETYFVDGANDGAGGDGVDSTDVITASAPIQVHMMTGSCVTAAANRGYSAHGYTLQPADVWSNDYWAPVPGFDCLPLNGTPRVDSDIYIHNPNGSTIDVTAESNLGTAVVPVPAQTTISLLSYVADNLGWADISTGSFGVHLYSAGVFWAAGVIDSASNATLAGQVAQERDWGYSLIPTARLSSMSVVGYAPGNDADPPTDNGNSAFVTAVTDTVLYVDLNQDGLPDPFDMNGDGDSNDNDVFGIGVWDEPLSAMGVPLAAGQVVRVGDPIDRNLQGARIYTLELDEKIAVAWGQDACRALRDNPYLDLGYTVLPMPIPSLSKVDELAIDADLSGSFSPGDVITYTLVLYNGGMGPMTDVVLTDSLPYTYTDFVVGSFAVSTPPPTDTIEYFDGSLPWTTDPLTDSQMFRVTWPVIGPRQTVTITFRLLLHADIPVTVTEVSNTAVVNSSNVDPTNSEDPDDPRDPDTDTPIGHPLLSISKIVTPTVVSPGGLLTYTVVMSNYGDGVALLTVVTDVLPSWIEYVPGTLDLTWPYVQVNVTTETVTHTLFYHGYYEDDFDLTATQTSNYTGSDGSLTWSGPWGEINDDNVPTTGEVQVSTMPGALSDPAYLEMTNSDSDDAGVQRTLDLSEFISPTLRYYVSGTTSLTADDVYTVTLGGLPIFAEVYTGGWALREIADAMWSAAGNSAAVVGFVASGNLEDLGAGDEYRFDNISVYERTQARTSTKILSHEYSVLVYTSTLDGDPVSYNPVSRQMVITEGLRMPPGGILTATFQARVTLPLTNNLTLTNTACVTSANWAEVTSPPCASAPVRIQSSHGLTITKTDDPDPAFVGGLLTYTLAYTASGDSPAPNVTITDTVPDDTTFAAAYGGLGRDTPAVGGTGTVTWYLGTLLTATSGITQQTGVVTLVVQISSQGVSAPISNTAWIRDDTDESDRDDELTTIVGLAITKTLLVPASGPALVGDVVQFEIVLGNTGSTILTTVPLTDTYDTGYLAYYQATPSPDDSVNDGTLTWTNVGPIAVGGRVTVTVSFTAVAPTVPGSTINTATASAVDEYNTDVPEVNDDAEVEIWSPTPDLEVIKEVVPGQAVRGMPFTYTVQVANAGSTLLDPVALTDTLPPDFYYIAGSGDPGEPDVVSEPTLVWSDLGALAPGESLTVTFAVTTATTVTGTYENVVLGEGVYVGGTVTDTDDAPVEIVAPAVALDKRLIDFDRDQPTNYVTFTIVITNVGVSTIDLLPLSDQYDTDYLAFDRAEPMPDEPEDDGLLTWFDLTAPGAHGFGRNLPPGETFVITTVFHVIQDIVTPTVNTALVSGAEDVFDNPANEAEDQERIVGIPTAVALLYFRVTPLPDGMLVEWETAVEMNTYGFYVLRSANSDIEDARAITFIPASGHGQGGGAVYRFKDVDIGEGQTLTYWLADVDTDGRRTIHRPVTVVADPAAWVSSVYLPLIGR